MALSSPSPDSLPDFEPVPEAAFGPALYEHGYFVGPIDLGTGSRVHP